MKRIFNFVAMLGIVLSLAAETNAQIRTEDKNAYKDDVILVTGFKDYMPLGFYEDIDGQTYTFRFTSVFEEVLKDFQESSGMVVKYIFNDDYTNLVTKVRGGNIDILLGAYYDTEFYEGIDFVFPSIINNPISIITLPGKTAAIKKLDDLKKLKGAISAKEHLSDYVVQQMKEYQVEKFDDSNKMYEKLFKGEIDYVFASHYFGLVDTSQLGIRRFLTFSKQIIWNMPLFFGVSKLSYRRNVLVNRLARYSEDPKNKEKIEKFLVNMVRKIEQENAGILPPEYTNTRPEAPVVSPAPAEGNAPAEAQK